MTAALAVAAGLLVGVVSGVIGVGGGILFVPIMVLGFGFGQHVAQGTSLAAILPTAMVGAVTHHRAGHVNVRAALWMGLAGTVGALLGAVLAIHLHAELLTRLFGAFLLFSAWRLWPREPKAENQER